MKVMRSVLAGLFVLAMGSAQATLIDQFNIPTGQVVTNIANDEQAAQTFRAGLSGRLDSIDLFLGQIGGSASVVVDVRTTDGFLPTGYPEGILGQSTVPVFGLPPAHPGGWVTFDFSSQDIFLEQGTTYAIVISRGSFDYTSAAWWGGVETYADGAFFGKYPSYPYAPFQEWHSVGPFDMGFRTNMEGSIPEPASLSLLGIALAGLGATRRRKQTATGDNQR